MVYLFCISCLRCTILVGNPWFPTDAYAFFFLVCWNSVSPTHVLFVSEQFSGRDHCPCMHPLMSACGAVLSLLTATQVWLDFVPEDRLWFTLTLSLKTDCDYLCGEMKRKHKHTDLTSRATPWLVHPSRAVAEEGRSSLSLKGKVVSSRSCCCT